MISGTALETNGEPSPGMEVWLVTDDSVVSGVRFMQHHLRPTRRTITDDAGKFRFEDTPPGIWIVGLAPPERRAQIPPEKAFAPIGFRTQLGIWDVELEIPVHRGLYIEGQVLDATGGDTENNASVSAHIDSGPSRWSSCEDARFRVGPLIPGEWTLRAMLPPTAEVHHHAPSHDQSLPAGTKDARLQLRSGGAVVAHAIEGDDREPVPALFQLYREAVIRTMGVQLKDEFSYSGLLPGKYFLSATTANGQIGLTTFKVDDGKTTNDVEVPLRACGYIDVEYTGPEDYASVSIVVDDVIWIYDTVRSGIPHRLMAPPGEVFVRVSKNPREEDEFAGFEESRAVRVVEGKWVTVKIAVPEIPD